MAHLSRLVSAPLLLRAAHVRRPHGVRGELRVEPLGGDAARFEPGLQLLRESDGSAVHVRAARDLPGGDVLLALDEVRSRLQADDWRDAYLCVPAAERRRLGDDEWFVHELVGLRAVTPDGLGLGTVAAVEDYPEHQVLAITDDNGEICRLPMARAFVRRVDLRAGVIEVIPAEEEP